MIRAIAFLLITIGFLSESEAQGQHLFRRGAVPQPTTSSVLATTPTGRVYTYSYYSRSALPARTYVGYGNNDFPYHGVPYGHPYDPYTFNAMSNSYGAEMSRYYYPPLK
jgi:hypothetical protein